VANATETLQEIERRIDSSLDDFNDMLDRMRDEYSKRMLEAKEEAKVKLTRFCSYRTRPNITPMYTLCSSFAPISPIFGCTFLVLIEEDKFTSPL
jgi:hypothetical protein